MQQIACGCSRTGLRVQEITLSAIIAMVVYTVAGNLENMKEQAQVVLSFNTVLLISVYSMYFTSNHWLLFN
jgi:hypothetical protein